ncbi:hypothetical protein RN001_014248 [Aquatica leii]|uniref:Cytochrome P450 n=1 Tax=Aquatica leii TaxID=1421715 RepID=A0AAN7SLY7_9COLE|nr:hypothetical protein RN001_014248 [Aquatica leii]
MAIKHWNFWTPFWPLSAVVLILVLVKLIKSGDVFKAWFRAVYLCFQLSGPPALPLFGNVFMVKDSVKFIPVGIETVKKYGPLFRAWITFIPTVIVADPKHIQIILSNTKHIDKNFLYSFMHTFLGEGLLTNSGTKWKLHRKYIQPYFHLNTLKMFISTFSECGQNLVEQLKNKNEVKITSYVNNCILNILHCALLGIPVKDYETKQQSPFNKGQLVIIQRLLKPWYIFNFTYQFSSISKQEVTQQLTLQEFAQKILERRRQGKGNSDWCLLDSFIEISESNPNFTDEQMINEICTFMLAGQDSVGAAVSFTLYNLAKHPDIQDKVFEEITNVFKEHPEITMESLNEMKYLEQCIKESLRLYPSVPLISKRLSEDVRLDNHTLPAGLNILIPIFVTHRLENYYPDPERFDPDRFLPENQEKQNPYAFIPFSAGSRNCIGYKFAYLEMKTIISTLLRQYKISAPTTYNLELMYRVTLRSKGGITLQIQPR